MNTLIFDCDGTLLDSYSAIVERLYHTYQAFGVEFPPERIRQAILNADTLTVTHEVCGLSGIEEKEFYHRLNLTLEDYSLMTLIPHCAETLQWLKIAGARLFVYTHRGQSTLEIFSNLGIRGYFDDIITSSYGLPRKPAPDGINYIIERYGLLRDEVYYVGDRRLDIECGKNAGVKTIFLKTQGLEIDTSKADIVIEDLLEIPEKLGC